METNTKSTPYWKPLLQEDLSGKLRKEEWNYQTAAGMLTYLQGNIRTNMSMAVNKTAQFSNNTPYTSKGLECYVDAKFTGGWSKE